MISINVIKLIELLQAPITGEENYESDNHLKTLNKTYKQAKCVSTE